VYIHEYFGPSTFSNITTELLETILFYSLKEHLYIFHVAVII